MYSQTEMLLNRFVLLLLFFTVQLAAATTVLAEEEQKPQPENLLRNTGYTMAIVSLYYNGPTKK